MGRSRSSSPKRAMTPSGRTPTTCSRSRRCQRFSSRCCRRSHCRYSPPVSLRPAAMTSTSRATWPSPSPSSSAESARSGTSAAMRPRAHFLATYRTAWLSCRHTTRHSTSQLVSAQSGCIASAGLGGRPVVLLPGRNASTPMWGSNLPGLLAHRTVFAVDLLGEPGLSVQEQSTQDCRGPGAVVRRDARRTGLTRRI